MGLGKLWHGVWIDRNTKKVPIIVPRYRPKPFTVASTVRNICLKSKKIEVAKKEYPENRFYFPFQRVTLAMGCIQNIQILRQCVGSTEPVRVNDHEIGFLGYISLSEGSEQGLVKKVLGIFILRGKVVRYPDALIDVRPSAKLGENIQNDFKLLNRSYWGIVWNLLKGMSAYKINQAFFNKYGIGFSTSRLLVHGQIVARECVTISDDKISRVRLTKNSIVDVIRKVESQFKSFNSLETIELIDGIHYQGGKNLLESARLQEALKNGWVRILGSPSNENFDECHTTEKDKSSIFKQLQK